MKNKSLNLDDFKKFQLTGTQLKNASGSGTIDPPKSTPPPPPQNPPFQDPANPVQPPKNTPSNS